MNDGSKNIKIENLTVDYQETVIFENFSATLPSKGCVCFFGPSGCGKTTLLQIIAGLKEPLSGTVFIEKKKNNNLPKIAYIFQEDRLIPWLTAIENVSLVAPMQTAMFWLEKVGLAEAKSKYPSQLSGGMKQRVNIARALAFDAPIILLDEPFKGLDETAKNQIIEIFNNLKKDKLLLLVTHDQQDIRLLADMTINMPDRNH